MKTNLLALLLAVTTLWAGDVVPGRYILELEGVPAARTANPTARRAELSAEHTRLEARLRTRGIRPRARLSMVANALVVDALDDAPLAALPGVKRVWPVHSLTLSLNNAAVAHHFAQAWDLAGGRDTAGSGIKIGLLDTGIDATHPAFQSTATPPEGFPKASSEDNLALTNGKIIVARSFDESTIQDTYGHGTGVAMAAAGLRVESPEGTISGAAPGAWIGVYRVFAQESHTTSTDVVLEAIDWAVADGMDVINMSLGATGALGPENDELYVLGAKPASDVGIVIVNAAGNDGTPMSVDDTAAGERVIAVGANNAVTSKSASVVPTVGAKVTGQGSSNSSGAATVMGPALSVAALDNEFGCQAYSVDLTGFIPIVERGGCTFADKLANAAAAGAAAAIVYNSSEPPSGSSDDVLTMDVSSNPTIPGVFVGRAGGLQLLDDLANNEDFQVAVRFPSTRPNTISYFSSLGPSVDLRIKPDLVASGSPVYTAGVIADSSECSICDPSGYVTTQGTSFSAPLVAGSAAVLKAVRPELDVDAYRSLLVNSSMAMVNSSGETLPVNTAGAGVLDLENAMRSTVAAAPVSVSFGSGSGSIDLTREFVLRNLGTTDTEYELSLETAANSQPELSVTNLAVPAGGSGTASLAWKVDGLAPGAYEGFVKVVDRSTLIESRIPYWHGVTGGAAAALTEIGTNPATIYADSVFYVFFRLHDDAGLPVTARPVVTPIYGGATVISLSASSYYPNTWVLRALGGPVAGWSIFQVQSGDVALSLAVRTY